VPGNAKRIIQYLMGADAAPPPAADKFKQGVQTEHPGVSEDDANLIAVHKAGEAGGPEAAWSMVQYNRSSYNAKQAFAKAALAGAQGKPPDIQAAASAATQASHHVLDGSQAVFIANPSGVTATVKMPGTRSRVSYNLTPQQFSQYLDVGGNGQWDKLMEQGGIPAALQKIAGARPAAQGAGAGQPEAGQQTAQADEDKGTQAPAKPAAPNGQFDPDLEARADRMFGKGKVYDPGRIQWMSEQESQQENRQNKLDVEGKKADAWKEVAQRRAGGQVDAAHERRLGTENAAATRSEGYAKAQQQKAQLALQKMAAQSRDSNERNRINVATRLINNPNWATQSADERNAILKNYGLDQLMEPAAPRTQAPTTPQAAAPQQQQQQNAPARLKLPDGKYYIKGPDGKAMLDPNQ
jgi:hypothetical protein